MANLDEGHWSSVKLSNSSRAWFVSEWKGKNFGNPDSALLFVVEVPQSKCISIALHHLGNKGWQAEEVVRLASEENSPDFLITDDQRLVAACTLAGCRFRKPASVFLEKPITLMPAINDCIQSLMALLNDVDFQSARSVVDINARLELWRTDYNQGAGSA